MQINTIRVLSENEIKMIGGSSDFLSWLSDFSGLGAHYAYKSHILTWAAISAFGLVDELPIGYPEFIDATDADTYDWHTSGFYD